MSSKISCFYRTHDVRSPSTCSNSLPASSISKKLLVMIFHTHYLYRSASANPHRPKSDLFLESHCLFSTINQHFQVRQGLRFDHALLVCRFDWNQETLGRRQPCWLFRIVPFFLLLFFFVVLLLTLLLFVLDTNINT